VRGRRGKGDSKNDKRVVPSYCSSVCLLCLSTELNLPPSTLTHEGKKSEEMEEKKSERKKGNPFRFIHSVQKGKGGRKKDGEKERKNGERNQKKANYVCLFIVPVPQSFSQFLLLQLRKRIAESSRSLARLISPLFISLLPMHPSAT